jgi:hypothetical protein
LNDYNFGCGIAADNFDNIYITGYSYNAAETKYKIILNKYDIDGTLLLNNTWYGNRQVEARKITTDSNNNVYITGFINNTLTNSRDVFTLKYDSTLNETWNKIWGGPDSDEGYNIAVDDFDNVYVTGFTKNYGNEDFLVLKYNHQGTLLWNRSWGVANSTDIAFGICLDKYNNAYLAGLVETFTDNMTQYRLVFIKFDKNGNFLGVNDPGFVEVKLIPVEIALDASNNIYIAGFYILHIFNYPGLPSNYLPLIMIDVYAAIGISIPLIISLVSYIRNNLSSKERQKRKVHKSDIAFRDYKEIKENIDKLKEEILDLNFEKRFIEAIKKFEILEDLLKKSKTKAKRFDKELLLKINQEIENIPSEIQQLKLAMAPKLIGDKIPKVVDKYPVPETVPLKKEEGHKNVFLSYSTLDSERFMIKNIAEELKKYPEIDEVLFWEADSSENIVEYMEETLRITNVFVIFCSQKSLQSKAVKDEWQAAFQLRKKDLMKIVPVYEKEEDIPYLLMPLLNVKFSKENFSDFIEKLYREILR